jgi:orotate phosphoribosyltransferase-like protein
MIALEIPIQRFTFWQRLKFLTGLTKGIVLYQNNITLEEGESLTVYSPLSAQKSVTMYVDDKGELWVNLKSVDGKDDVVIKGE